MRGITEKIVQAKYDLSQNRVILALTSIMEAIEILATPEPDTTELTKDRLQEIIREYQEAQLGLINKQYEALKERDAVCQKLELAESKAAKEFLLHQEARDKTRQTERRAEAAEKEGDDLRELFQKFYTAAIQSRGKLELSNMLIFEYPEIGNAILALGLEPSK